MEAVDPERPRHEQGRERAEHVDFAMGEVDQLDDAVDERIAQGDERVDAASGQAAEKELDEKLDVHLRPRVTLAKFLP